MKRWAWRIEHPYQSPAGEVQFEIYAWDMPCLLVSVTPGDTDHVLKRVDVGHRRVVEYRVRNELPVALHPLVYAKATIAHDGRGAISCTFELLSEQSPGSSCRELLL